MTYSCWARQCTVIPPPYWHPASPVRENAIFEARRFRVVVVSDLDTVVGVDALRLGKAQIILSVAILVGDQLEPFFRHPKKLSAQARVAVVLRIGLPSVDEPGFDFQLVGGEPLNAHAVEEPRRIGGNIGRLIGPVIEIVVAEQADVRHEDSGVDIEPVVNVEVISAVSFRNILVSTLQVPLADSAGIPGATVAELASLRGVVVANNPSMNRIRPRTFCQWKSPPTLACSIWTSPERNDSVAPTMV